MTDNLLLPLGQMDNTKKPENEDFSRGKVRLRPVNRSQIEMNFHSIDDAIPSGHIARIIWRIVNGFDLSEFLAKVNVFEGCVGRPAIDPKILLSLWIYATIEGIGSARMLSRYCKEHLAFKWLCGGMSISYHTLSDFRNNGVELGNLLSQIIGVLIKQGTVSTETWAQDGMRVKANAGKSSFKREKTLLDCIEQAEKRLNTITEEIKSDPSAFTRREQAAMKRAAQEEITKTNDALKELRKIQESVNKNRHVRKIDKKKRRMNARVSTTDSEARNIKMANGGFAPGYNVQFATDTQSKIITLAHVSQSSSDVGQMGRMIEQVKTKYEMQAENWLADAGFFKSEDVIKATEDGINVYMPIPKHFKAKGRMQIKKGEDLSYKLNIMKKFAARMDTPSSKELYKDRASTAEFANASVRNRGLYQFAVRGLEKVKSSVLIFVLTHNLERIISLARKKENGFTLESFIKALTHKKALA